MFPDWSLGNKWVSDNQKGIRCVGRVTEKPLNQGNTDNTQKNQKLFWLQMAACFQIPHAKIKENRTEYRRNTPTNRIIWIYHVYKKDEVFLEWIRIFISLYFSSWLMELISIYFKGLGFKLWILSFSFTSGVPGDERVQ